MNDMDIGINYMYQATTKRNEVRTVHIILGKNALINITFLG